MVHIITLPNVPFLKTYAIRGFLDHENWGSKLHGGIGICQSTWRQAPEVLNFNQRGCVNIDIAVHLSVLYRRHRHHNLLLAVRFSKLGNVSDGFLVEAYLLPRERMENIPQFGG